MSTRHASALELITYLGVNTVDIADRLSGLIAQRTGLDVVTDRDASWDERLSRIRAGSGAVLWMCGLLATELLDAGLLDAAIVAAPVFPRQPGPVYHSVILVRAELGDARHDLTLAVNEAGSWSGNHALRAHLDGARVPPIQVSKVVESGGHDESINLLLSGDADAASIDHTVWDHRVAHDPGVNHLRVLERTRDWPAPPFLVSAALGPAVRSSLVAALPKSTPEGLDAIVSASSADYDSIRSAMSSMRSGHHFVPDVER